MNNCFDVLIGLESDTEHLKFEMLKAIRVNEKSQMTIKPLSSVMLTMAALEV